MILTEKRAQLLKDYVAQGGTLIIGARTGQKDITGRCVMQPMPGLLADITGSDVAEFTFVGPADEPQFMNWDGNQIETGLFSDILDVTDENAKVLATYGNDYYQGRATMIENSCGKGKVIHFGGTFTRNNVKAFMEYTGILSPYSDVLELPAECEIAVKEKNGKQYYFVLNYSRECQKINLKNALTDMDTKEVTTGEIILKPYETKVYCK